MEKERKIEFLVGFAFIIFLTLIVILLLNFGEGKMKEDSKSSSEPNQIIINNYYENNYNYPEKSPTGNVVYKYENGQYVVYKYDDEKYGRYVAYKDDNEKEVVYDKYREDWTYSSNRNDNDFSSSGNHKKVKNGPSYTDEYYVYVRNEDSVGKYFKVIFYFENDSDLDSTEIMSKYIRSGETRKFIFRDVHFEKDNYNYWDYKVFSQDSGFE